MNPSPDAPAHLAALVGQSVNAIDTPALVIDLDTMERNLTRMADFARKHGLRLRPHAKMHKSATLALLQMQHGAVGVCVQKTAEAEALADGGVTDIYISNEIIAPAKLRRVALLAHRLGEAGGRLAIAVDSLEGITRLGAEMDAHWQDTGLPAAKRDASGDAVRIPINVFVEIDVGQGRCGARPGEAAVALAQAVVAQPSMHFSGLQAYHGRAQHLRSPTERLAAIRNAADAVQRTRALIEAAGIPVELITGAGTGTFALEAASGVWGELQVGSYLFMDGDYARNARDTAQPAFEHALFIKSHVISVSADRAVVDAGHKSHAIDSGLPVVATLPGQQAWGYDNGGDEHGILRTAESGPDAAPVALPTLGETVWLIPGHCDPTVNLHDWLIGVRGGLEQGRVEQLLRVDARGALT